MTANDNTFEWKPLLTTEFRTVEFRHTGSDIEEKQIRALRVSEQGLRDLAEELEIDGFDKDPEFEIEDDQKIDPDKKLVEMFEYWQAFKNGDKWTVQSVQTKVLQNGKTMQKPYVLASNRNLTALEAVGKLTSFEAYALENSDIYEVTEEVASDNALENSRAVLGSRHFIQAAEEEGLLFDNSLVVFQRINKFVLPETNDEFEKDSVERANKRWEEGLERIANSTVSAETMLEQMAVNVPENSSIDRVLKSIKATEIMDNFARKIGDASNHLSSYVDRYDRTEQGGLIESAIEDLIDSKTGALSYLNKLKYENIMRDTTEWENFVKEAHVACHVVHAQAMLHLLKSNAIDDDKSRESLEKDLRSIGGTEDANGKVTKRGDMEKLARKYNLSENIIAKTKRAMGVSTGPEMPKLLSGYLERYQERKAIYEKSRDNGKILDAETLLPPTHKLTVHTAGKKPQI